MEDITNRVEAILFSNGKKTTLEELRKLCRVKESSLILKAVEELKARHGSSTALMVVDEGKDAWKMTIREKYLHFIRKIVTDTELSKTLMETLAVIAWKAPVLQADVIKIRTNKAYDHIKQLEDADFIASVKHGRSRLLKLTSKFYEYFDVDNEKEVKEMFRDVKADVLPQAKINDFMSLMHPDAPKQIEAPKQEKVEVYEQEPEVQIYETQKSTELQLETDPELEQLTKEEQKKEAEDNPRVEEYSYEDDEDGEKQDTSS